MDDPTPRSTVSTHHIRVTRTARYYTLGADLPEANHIWIALHGYAMMGERFARLLAPLADAPGSLVVSAEALSRFYLETGRDGRHSDSVGATWLTREDRENEIADAIHYLDQLHAELVERAPPSAVVSILGFSQGAAMAARWVAIGAVLPEQLVIWGINPPSDALPQVAERMAGREVVLIAGDRDPFAPEGGIESVAASLSQQGVRARAERFRGGHALSKSVLRRLGEGNHHP
jgi:predicted esterase